VVLVININISLVGLTLLPSMFQVSSTMEWHGLEDVEPLQDAKDKELAQASRSRLYIFYFSDPIQYFGYQMQRADLFEKTLMLGKSEAGGEGDDRE